MNFKSAICIFALLFSISTFTGCGEGSGASLDAANSAPTDNYYSDGTNSTLPPFSGGGTGVGVATLTWTAPETNTDGSALTDLAGYKIYFGTEPGKYTATITIGLMTDYKVNELAPGTYYIAVTAFNAAGAESGYSNEESKTIL